MGCTLCVKACPVTAKAEKDGTPEKKAIEMTAQATQLDQQEVFDYCVANGAEKLYEHPACEAAPQDHRRPAGDG